MLSNSMEFRPRNYTAEKQAHALPRSRADGHPLSAPSSPPRHQVEVVDDGDTDYLDPLRRSDNNAAVSIEDLEGIEDSSASGLSSEASIQNPSKEWVSFKRSLMQRFPVSKTVLTSSMSDVIVKGRKTFDKSSTNMHLEELEDPEKFAEEGGKVITGQEYVSRLHELKAEINHTWHADDRVTSLKLSIKVAKLLMDTSILQCYPTLFVLATDIMDMLGDMVWERIKLKAELAEDGTKLCLLPENFMASDICSDAKETCNNWFSKIGAIRELLPRIYLELALLPCWRFLHDRPLDCLQRLVMMTRGLADPLASAYCRLYMAHCFRKLHSHDIGCLLTCVNDFKILLMRVISAKETFHRKLTENKRLLISLMEPTIDYIMKCIFKNVSEVNDVLVELGLGSNQVELRGRFPCASIILHHLVKQLPSQVVSSSAMEIIQLIDSSNDDSYDQCLNYRLLGFRLCERKSEMGTVNAVVDKIIQVITQYEGLDEYLKVVDAYVDIFLQNHMDDHLNSILEGISNRACSQGIAEDELTTLQSILVKLLSYYEDLQDVIAMTPFLKILDLMHGSSQSIVNMQILDMGIRNGYIRDRTTIQFLFEISQALHDDEIFVNVKDDSNQAARLISSFVSLVDYGGELESHLTFLVECRAAFGSIHWLKETLVHSSNCLAIKALKDGSRHISFIKSCIAFSEVTLPSISAQTKQLNLYLETAEVALLGGLVSHSDGLIDSAINSLQISEVMDGSRTPTDADGILSSILKLFSLLVMVPGNPEHGVTFYPKNLVSLVNSQPWMPPRMRVKIFCAVVSLLAALSQRDLPYHADKGKLLGNDILFFGHSLYLSELALMCKFVLQNLVDTIQQEPSKAARGSMALEACNCIASSFIPSQEISSICANLIETGKSCMGTSHPYLLSTIKFTDQLLLPSIAV
ncbi:putative vacuolar protein sorting-associated protein [Rosa chinensis]|uniref:Putative vacuolar protein sorting-associated protein n=1 Tax=Rosa chinensis TaxID=74649 RepID=A0A2P6QCM2_ROSCH|nr:VPS35 endosomal protein-sorting factor-like isoform X2 [Rosa chinensis]PRQ31929.1 putative vacuolar protein sorting-associated protein [Rosa chinensis]